MIEIDIFKNEVTTIFIKSNEGEIDYIENFDRFIISCNHTYDCACKRVEKVNRLMLSFDTSEIKEINTIATLSRNIKINKDMIKTVDLFHAENKRYLILIIENGCNQELSIYDTVYDHNVFNRTINSNKTLIEALTIFKYSDIKLPKKLILNIESDIRENHLSGFMINIDKYNFRLLNYNQDRDLYNAIFENPETGHSILINKIIINEMDGSVYKCGENPEMLTL